MQCTELPPIPMERIAQNALGALSNAKRRVRSAECRTEDISARDVLHSQFCILHSDMVGLLFPVNHAPAKMASLNRLRSGDLLHEQQACWLDYTTGTR